MTHELIALHETAADWFLRRDAASWTGADERAMNAWLAADPAHREAFDTMARTSQDLHSLPLARVAARRALTPHPAVPARPRAAAVLVRRAFAPLLAASLVLLAAGYGWSRWDDAQRYSLDLHTAQGETRSVALPDGSRVTLNFGSRLQVRYDRLHRAVRLDSGEAFFEVAADQARPFTVDSGPSQVQVVGTAFNVRAAPPQTVVKVRQGRVEVRPRSDTPDRVLALGPGTGVAIDATSGQHYSVPAATDSVGDWRGGQLHFQRTPLAEVAQELARYLGQPVTLASADLALLPISGVAATAAPQVFLQALPDFLPLRVRQQANGSWQIARP